MRGRRTGSIEASDLDSREGTSECETGGAKNVS